MLDLSGLSLVDMLADYSELAICLLVCLVTFWGIQKGLALLEHRENVNYAKKWHGNWGSVEYTPYGERKWRWHNK